MHGRHSILSGVGKLGVWERRFVPVSLMVSPIFFLEKLTTVFSHRSLWKFSCRLLTTPTFDSFV